MQCIVDYHAEEDGDQFAIFPESEATLIPPEHCVWKRNEPNAAIFIVYAFVVPVLSSFGLCANFINAIVFMRPKMTPSAFSYLAALSWLDCTSCLFIMLTALSRSIFYESTFWVTYDFQWQTPLFGITTGAANLILGSVSCDRLVYLWNGVPNVNGPPRFCRRKVARRVIAAIILVSIIVNFPYFFVFVVNEDGTFRATKFYYSHYYKIHNWFTFVLLTLLPAIFLLIGNAAIIIAFRRWTKQSKLCQKRCRSNGKTTQKRYQHQMKLTITILIVITLYMVGELPAHMTSRKSALNLLFGGDVSKVNFKVMERLEVVCITLNALQLSLNIIVYAVINPSFLPEFFLCLRGASDICFKLFCLTALGNCWRSCCNKKITKRQDVETLGCEHNVPEFEQATQYKSNMSISSSSSNNWDTESISRSHGTGLNRCAKPDIILSHRNRFNSKMYAESGIWSIELNWKRSSSFGDFSFDKKTTDMSESVCDVDVAWKMRQRPKRHSLAM